jgi:transcriptional regulator GlxA family with amidase domain
MDRRVKKVVALIEENLHRTLLVNELSHSVNLSPSRLRYLFKAEIGMSLARYIKSLRLQRAKTLLETSFLNVKEITIRVGAKDESRFVQDFKKAFGLTPAQYRRQYDERKSNENEHTKEGFRI